jgi:hypothetical protein
MRRIITVLFLCFLSTLIFSQANKNVEISKLVISSFQKNEFSKIVESFDETMKSALPVEKLKLVWDDLNAKCGKFQKMSDITVDKIQNYDVTYVLCHFENMNLKMKTVFNGKNQIAGMFFIPENQK